MFLNTKLCNFYKQNSNEGPILLKPVHMYALYHFVYCSFLLLLLAHVFT